MSMNDPVTYIKYAEDAKVYANELLDEIKDQMQWREDENILDVGCGPGNITAHLLPAYLPVNSKIMGIDISKEMIEYAKQKYITENLSFKIADICDKDLWNISRQQFTKIYSFFCLHRVNNKRTAYQNIYDLLTPGGYLISTLIIDNDKFTIHRHVAKNPIFRKHKDELLSYVNENIPEDTITLLKSIGFDIKFNTVRRGQYLFKTFEELLEFIQSVNSIPHLLTREIVKQAIEEINQGPEEMQIFKKSDDGFILKIVCHYVVAKKPA